jgi:hypothetical protein
MQQTASQPPSAAVPVSKSLPKVDPFTLAVALGVLVLIPIAFVLVLSQPRAEPLAESTPSGVVHNYYLAVMHDDLSAAYGYLSTETRGWLTYEQFTAQASSRPETRGVRIIDERIEDSTARVTVSVTLYVPTGPISNGEVTTQHSLVLRQEAGNWRIALPEPPATPGYSPYGLYGW